jgi:hypothetical protein
MNTRLMTSAELTALLRDWLADAEHGGRRLRWFNRSMATVLVATAAWMVNL